MATAKPFQHCTWHPLNLLFPLLAPGPRHKSLAWKRPLYGRSFVPSPIASLNQNTQYYTAAAECISMCQVLCWCHFCVYIIYETDGSDNFSSKRTIRNPSIYLGLSFKPSTGTLWSLVWYWLSLISNQRNLVTHDQNVLDNLYTCASYGKDVIFSGNESHSHLSVTFWRTTVGPHHS